MAKKEKFVHEAIMAQAVNLVTVNLRKATELSEDAMANIAKSIMQKSVLVSFEEDNDELVMTKAEALELVANLIESAKKEAEAKKMLEIAGGEAKSLIESLAIQVVEEATTKKEAIEKLTEVIPSEEFATALLDKAIGKEIAKANFADTKAARFCRCAAQILKGEGSDSEKMNAILTLVKSRFSSAENQAMLESLKAEAESNIGAPISVSREDGTNYKGTILGIATTGGTVSYRIKSDEGIQLLGVAQRLSYELGEKPVVDTQEGDAEAE